MAVNETDKMSRLKLKLKQKMENKEYYEAFQLYKTLSFRFCSQNKISEALDLIYEGSLNLLDSKQISSGLDLALLFLDILFKNNVKPDQQNISKVSKLHKQFPKSHVDRQKFVVTAINWCKKSNRHLDVTSKDSTESLPQASASSSFSFPPSSNSNPNLPNTQNSFVENDLHEKFGITYFEEEDYYQARYHIYRSKKGEACGGMLVKMHLSKGEEFDLDLFIVQAVLQILCLRDKQTAEKCFSIYTKEHPQLMEEPPYSKPLLNFLRFLLLTIEEGDIKIFMVLREQYDISLRRDPFYYQYLDKIGQIFFNVSPPKMSNKGLLASLLPELMNIEEQEDFEPTPVDLD